jgi:hypothetical protein
MTSGSLAVIFSVRLAFASAATRASDARHQRGSATSAQRYRCNSQLIVHLPVIGSAAAANGLPFEFLAQVIWQDTNPQIE